MVQPVLVVTLEMTLWQVAARFTSHKISGAPVVGPRGDLLSVLGEGLTLRLAASEGLEATVRDCLPKMTPTHHIITVKPESTFTEAYKLFLKHNIHRLPVVDDNGQVLGILSRSMILRLFVEAHYGKKLPG